MLQLEFVQSLTYNTVTQHLDFNFDRHCKDILYETTTGDLMELGSTSIVNEDSRSASNSYIQPRGELSILCEGTQWTEEGFSFLFSCSGDFNSALVLQSPCRGCNGLSGLLKTYLMIRHGWE